LKNLNSGLSIQPRGFDTAKPNPISYFPCIRDTNAIIEAALLAGCGFSNLRIKDPVEPCTVAKAMKSSQRVETMVAQIDNLLKPGEVETG